MITGFEPFDGFKDRIRKVEQIKTEFENQRVTIQILDDLIMYQIRGKMNDGFVVNR